MVNDARSRSSSLDLRALVSVLFFGNDEGPGLVERRWGEVLATRWAASDLRKFKSVGSATWVEEGDRDVFTSSERLLVSVDDSPSGWVESWTNVSTTWRNWENIGNRLVHVQVEIGTLEYKSHESVRQIGLYQQCYELRCMVSDHLNVLALSIGLYRRSKRGGP